MPDRVSVHLDRAMVTDSVLGQVPSVPDLPLGKVAAYRAGVDC